MNNNTIRKTPSSSSPWRRENHRDAASRRRPTKVVHVETVAEYLSRGGIITHIEDARCVDYAEWDSYMTDVVGVCEADQARGFGWLDVGAAVRSAVQAPSSSVEESEDGRRIDVVTALPVDQFDRVESGVAS